MHEDKLNWAIELHDSEIHACWGVGSDLILAGTAYLHCSEGSPGFDVAKVYVQSVAFVFGGGEVRGETPDLPWEIGRGTLQVGEQSLHNMLELPVSWQGPTQFEILTLTGATVRIEATGVTLTLLGRPEYVEEFRPPPAAV